MKKNIVISVIIILMQNLLFAQPIIIDNTHTEFNSIDKEKISKITNNLRVAYQHTSHGSQLVTGLQALKKFDENTFGFEVSNSGLKKGIFFNDYAMVEFGANDLGHNGDIAWVKATEDFLNKSDCDRNVIMWSWCGGCSDNTETGINAYLKNMDKLEKKFPNVTFVYMTGHLDGSGKNGNLNKINNIIRTYCKDNNKVLFDFADIESYAPQSGVNLMEKNADDECRYDSNGDGVKDANWAEEWIKDNPNDVLTKISTDCSDCAHSHKLNCVRKGIATWNLFNEIYKRYYVGIEEDTVKYNDNTIISLYPNPADKEINLSFYLKESASVLVDIYDANGNLVLNVVNHTIKYNKGENLMLISLERLAIGKYDIHLSVNNDNLNKPFVISR